MNPKRWIVLFLTTTLSINFSYSQKRVVISPVSLENQGESMLMENVIDSVVSQAFFTSLEKILKSEFGPCDLHYSGGKKIYVPDALGGKSVHDAMAGYREYYNALREAKKDKGDVNVRVQLSLVSNNSYYKKSRLIAKIKVRDGNEKKMLKKKSSSSFVVAEVPFNPGSFRDSIHQVYARFPINSAQIAGLISTTVSNLPANKRVKEPLRFEQKDFAFMPDFVGTADTWRIAKQNNYAQYKVKPVSFILKPFMRTIYKSPVLKVDQLATQKTGLLYFQERKFSDLNMTLFTVGTSQNINLHYFRLYSQNITSAGIQEYRLATKSIEGFINGDLSLNTSVHLSLFDQNKENKLGELQYGWMNNPLNKKENVLYPDDGLSGELFGKSFTMTAAPEAANAILINVDHATKGMLTRPMAPRKYLRKGGNYVPYLLHLSPGLTEREIQFILQGVQIYFIGENLKTQQRNRVSQRSNGQQVTN